ncbi:MAG TPA: trigger factor [Chitinophagaceae bacterium]|nr:trigger factor [Chitinophagaceae bacterium]HMZ45523.1 trigger factor [Chitinophagaceae bacterium]HNE93782.1 trigger factor [Chitinophagaceae bacterium]HNF29096.1 trigger factor [Chitinophagaceae bacterium]HNL81989.1 trigger factor [Chitinophagaceae bacterium]
MATVTRENIGNLTDKLTVNLSKEDYLKNFETSLKKYAKTANIPGFRKGMVPAGLVKKMYGQSVFTDEVLRTVETQLNEYLTKEKLEIFAQPLPLDSDARALDMNNPMDYAFAFEIGLKPSYTINTNFNVTRYKINVTNEMLNDEIDRLQRRFGKMTEPATVTDDETMLNVTFTEVDKEGNMVENGINKPNSVLVKYFAPAFRANLLGKKLEDVIDVHLATAFEDKELDVILSDLGLDKNIAGVADKNFKLTITKIGLVEKAAINNELFIAAYPNKEIKTEEEFNNAVKEDIEAYFTQQSNNQIHDQIYHQLLDNTSIDFPEAFLKRWIQTNSETPKTIEEAEQEFPSFKNSLKWTLITSQLSEENKIEVLPEDLRNFAKQQLFQYMGNQLGILDEQQQWIEDYADKMMKDKKFVEDSYHRISTEKLFNILAQKVNATEESISAEDFASKLHHHHH